MQPFVSCIMPTYNRRQFAPRAIESYLSQTWKEKELVVVDDGTDPIFDLLVNVPNLVYVRVPGRMQVGRKRNIANEHAAGEFIAHWDDDDWSVPNRLERQMARMQIGKSVTGYRDMMFWDGVKASEYKGDEKYACGTSLVYRKAYWAEHRFPDVKMGEDNHMVYRAGNQIVTESGRGMIVAAIHGDNTSQKSSFLDIPTSDLPEGFLAIQHNLKHLERGGASTRLRTSKRTAATVGA